MSKLRDAGEVSGMDRITLGEDSFSGFLVDLLQSMNDPVPVWGPQGDDRGVIDLKDDNGVLRTEDVRSETHTDTSGLGGLVDLGENETEEK